MQDKTQLAVLTQPRQRIEMNILTKTKNLSKTFVKCELQKNVRIKGKLKDKREELGGKCQQRLKSVTGNVSAFFQGL